MKFPGENVFGRPWKTEKACGGRGKLAVNAQKLYQAVGNGKIKVDDSVSATKKRTGHNLVVQCNSLCFFVANYRSWWGRPRGG